MKNLCLANSDSQKRIKENGNAYRPEEKAIRKAAVAWFDCFHVYDGSCWLFRFDFQNDNELRSYYLFLQQIPVVSVHLISVFFSSQIGCFQFKPQIIRQLISISIFENVSINFSNISDKSIVPPVWSSALLNKGSSPVMLVSM